MNPADMSWEALNAAIHESIVEPKMTADKKRFYHACFAELWKRQAAMKSMERARIRLGLCPTCGHEVKKKV